MESNEKTEYIPLSIFKDNIRQNPGVTMIWGDVGVGKTTISLQVAQEILMQGKKVFYLSTKKGSLSGILPRFFPLDPTSTNSNIIFWTAENFNQQIQIISKWLLQIQKINQLKQVKKVGLLVIDEIVNLYLIEIGSQAKNSKLNNQITHVMAILSKLAEEFKIPIIILNSFATKLDHSEKQLAIPHGGKIINYWVRTEIQLKRTPQPSRMIFKVRKNSLEPTLPSQWTWVLTEKGFK